jgi:hypothetical protein
MSLENITYLASKKVDIKGNDIDCIIGVDSTSIFIDDQLDGLQADGWVIVPNLKATRLADLYNAGSKWFWDSRNIPYATEVERNTMEATY